MVTRPYAAAHFATPTSRGWRGECARCIVKIPKIEVRSGKVWLPLCESCWAARQAAHSARR